MKENIIKKIILLVKELKIKSLWFEKNNEKILIDYKNVSQYDLLQGKISLSKKNLKFFNKEEMNFIIDNFINEEGKYKIILRNGNVIFIDYLTQHSREQFIKRYRLCFLKYKENIKSLNLETFQEIDKIYQKIKKNNKLLFSERKYIDNLILKFLNKSKTLTDKKVGRIRDKKELNKRDTRYKGLTLRLHSYPFLFIISEKKLKTIELYSSNLNLKPLNDITSNKIEKTT